MSEKLFVPDIGDFENVEVIEILVREGEEILKNDPVITIESDKSSVEIPSTISGKIELIKVKVGDKVSKGDLILNILSSDQTSSTSTVIPKDTENLILEAENALKKPQKQKSQLEIDKPKIIQTVKDGDLDPQETNEWLESLTAVIEKDGNQRAHYLIKELINKAYTKGANIPYTQNTPYINTIPTNEEKKSNGDQI